MSDARVLCDGEGMTAQVRVRDDLSCEKGFHGGEKKNERRVEKDARDSKISTN